MILKNTHIMHLFLCVVVHREGGMYSCHSSYVDLRWHPAVVFPLTMWGTDIWVVRLEESAWTYSAALAAKYIPTFPIILSIKEIESFSWIKRKQRVQYLVTQVDNLLLEEISIITDINLYILTNHFSFDY